MKAEKVVTTVVSFELNEKEYVILKALLNYTGETRDNCIKENSSLWKDYMDLEEALELVCEVEDMIWSPRCSTGSEKK